MDSVGGLALAWRLGVAAVAVVGPTVLYLGLWRFLSWLRDDALIERLAARGAVETPRPAPADVLAAATESVDGRRCPDCGTTVVAGATRCRTCQRDLGGSVSGIATGTRRSDEGPTAAKRRERDDREPP